MLTTLTFLTLLPLLYTFNIDTQSVYILKSSKNEAFGYSVALHKGSKDNYLLVGAPTAQTPQDGVQEAGTVFKCKLGADIGDPTSVINCTDQITFLDDTGELYSNPTTLDQTYDRLDGYYPKENKSLQWMGVSVMSSNDYVVSCAHRYESKYYLTNLYDDPPRQLIGKCVTVSQDLDDMIKEFTPCKNRGSDYTKYGSCQAGTSIALDRSDLVIGAPGKFEWSGGAFLFSPNDTMAIHGIESIELKKLSSIDVFEPYTGYSSVICDMNGDGSSDYILGGPRGHLYKGEVFIFNKNDDKQLELVGDLLFPLWHPLEGDQIGSYYGHSLACADFNGDGFDDLVVGAPWYTDYSVGAGIPADTGRVYIYTASPDFLPEELDLLTIDGDQPNGAFGFSLEVAGDTNKDGYKDLFIGSPFYNDGEGVVYLYLGSNGGIQSTPSQVIMPSKLNILDNIKSFGWSLSAGKDMDNNGYPDILVGSYKTGHSIFLRTMKIVDVTPHLKFTKDTIEPKENAVNVPERPGLMVPGTYLNVCFKYTGEKLGKDSSVTINYKVNLDTTRKYSARLYFNYTNPVRTYTNDIDISLADDSLHCMTKIPVYYKENTLDVRPVVVDIEAHLANAETFEKRSVLNQETIKDVTARLRIASKCPANTGVCLVDTSVQFLDVEFKESNLYDEIVIDYVPRISLPIKVSNNGPNHAYSTVLNITLSQHLVYNGLKQRGSQGVKCEPEGISLICTMPDPMEPGISWLFKVEFSLVLVNEPMSLDITGRLNVQRPSVEQRTADNIYSHTIHVKKLAELSIRGGATQRKLPFNNKYTIVNDYTGSIGPTVRHNFEVTLDEDAINEDIDNITVDIYWPHKFPNQAWLLPLTSIVIPKNFNDSAICTHDDLEKLLENDPYWFPPEVDPNIGSVSCAENKTNCLRIRCTIERMYRGSAFSGEGLFGFKITLLAKIHESSLFNFLHLNITSLAELVSVENGLILPKHRSATAVTELYVSKSKSRNLIWIIIGSILGGLLLLLLLVLLLCRYSTFFKRRDVFTRATFNKIETHTAEKTEAIF